MAVQIFDVKKGSPAGKKGVCPGDRLISINGHAIDDVLDYRFYAREDRLRVVYENARGKEKHFTARADGDPDAIGMEFETYLMDRHRSCKNHCIFCFIDQLPKGLRPSLYFKDDDSRLSFLFGNYITLTNLTPHEADRIIEMHISPINASVHTMDPALRVKMMKNPKAGESLSFLRRFSDAGIEINAQLVLCPGVNDGEQLDYSLEQLSLLPGVRSVAAVPVGLTKFREGLYPLQKYTSEGAADVIDRIDAFNEMLVSAGREKLAYPSDEFFQLCGRPLPPYDYYGDFPQIENGVGLCAAAEHDFREALAQLPPDDLPRRFALATGVAAAGLLKKLAALFIEKFPGSEIEVYALENRFFGPDVTVAGLLTGRDVIDGLRAQSFNSPLLLLPSVMFKGKDELIFLDDVSKADVEAALSARVLVTDCDGAALADTFYEIKTQN